jgi:surface-anchored protein/LPXTG-motif cell wall-anchored protein
MLITKRPRAAGGVVGLLAMAGALLTPLSATAAERIELDTGHIDAFNVTAQNGELLLQLKEDTSGVPVVHEAADVTLKVKEDAFYPAIPDAYPGAPSGYVLPLTQDPNLIWPGWDTNGTRSSGFTDVSIDLSSVDGPGTVFLYTLNSFGGPTPILTEGDYELPGTLRERAPAHTHAQWTFSEAGAYKITAKATATNPATGESITSAEQSYNFQVGDPAPAPIETELSVTGLADSYAAGETVSLSAEQNPATDLDHYHWFTRTGDSGEWVAASGALTSKYSFDATDEMNGLQVQARLYDEDHAVVAESAPVTVVIRNPAPVTPTVAIKALGSHYHQGNPIALEATTSPEVDGASYRWSIQRADQSQPVVLDGVTGASHTLAAEQALHRAVVSVELLNAKGNVVATSSPATISVDDHGASAHQRVTIDGLAGHYHSGDTATLTATTAPASIIDTHRWTVQKSNGEITVVDGESGPSYSFEVTEELAGATVTAALVLDNGTVYVASQPVIVEIDDHHSDIPETTLALSADKSTYLVGQTGKITAKQSPATSLTSYQWAVKKAGESEFTVVAAQTTEVYNFKPVLALDGAQVVSRLMHDGEVHAQSEPLTLDVELLAATTVITATADKSSYQVGDVATFTSAQNPPTDEDHYHWYIKRAGQQDYTWIDQSRDASVTLPITEAENGASVIIRLFNDDHAILAESAPVVVTVADAPIVPTLSIDGLESSYFAGDVARFSAVQNPGTDEDHYHWFIKRTGDESFTSIRGALSATLEHTIDAEDNGAQLVAMLYDHDHTVIAESEPVTLTVAAGERKPGAAPTERTEAEIDGIELGGITIPNTTVAAGSTLTIELGAANAGNWFAAWMFSEPVLLAGDWVQANAEGRIAVVIPASTEAGVHRLAVYDSSDELVGLADLTVTVAAAAPAPGTGTGGDNAGGTNSDLPNTGADIASFAGLALLLLMAGAGVLVTQRRRQAALDNN